eukprot:359688-Amorphochlora_amoeboformis.AAC.2
MEGRLAFGATYAENRHLVLEVTKDMLAELEKADSVFQVRGLNKERAYLVTKDKTYEIQSIESSNTQLLIKKRDESIQPAKRLKSATGVPDTNRIVIEASTTTHMALRETIPSIYTLYQLLRTSPEYSDEEAEAGGTASALRDVIAGAKLYRFDDLCDALHCSDKELRKYLRMLHAIEINGFWRLLSTAFADDLIEFVLATIEMNGWAFDSVPVSRCVEDVKADYPAFLVHHALRLLCKSSSEGAGANGNKTIALDPAKICLFKAELLFHKKSTISDRQLMNEWGKMLPQGLMPDRNLLGGVAIESKTPEGVKWTYVTHLMLPALAADRMDALFELRPRWKLEDLRPYMECLRDYGETLEQLVLKHAREVDGYCVPIVVSGLAMAR